MSWPIRVSQLAQLIGCGGSWAMQLVHPEAADAINQAAAEGTAAHEAAARVLVGEAPDVMGLIGWTASNGVQLDRSLCEAAQMYVKDVQRVAGEGGDLHVEELIEVIPGVLGGTPDAWHLHGSKLTVWDFKSGHNPIEAFENYQLLGYLMGILRKLGVNGLQDGFLRVELRIVQPRARHRLGPIRSWQFVADAARGYFNIIEDACSQALIGNASTRSGSGCLWCSARAYCEAATKAAGAAIQFIGSTSSIPVEPEAAAYELELLERAIEAAKTRRGGLIEVVEHSLRSGKQIAQFVLEPKYGRDSWNVPDQNLFIMGDALGVDLRNTKPITPTQAIAAGLSPDVVNSIRDRKATGFELVRADASTAKQIFGSN
jgi:hypothetical protein